MVEPKSWRSLSLFTILITVGSPNRSTSCLVMNVKSLMTTSTTCSDCDSTGRADSPKRHRSRNRDAPECERIDMKTSSLLSLRCRLLPAVRVPAHDLEIEHLRPLRATGKVT